MNVDVIHWGQIAAAVTAILGLGGLLVKYTILKPLKLYIDHATRPIQPDANGGKSLPDLVEHVAELRGMLQSHLDSHHHRPGA
jgi:hypothetical protein